MNRTLAFAALIFAYAISIPAPAQAYLLPLIGAAPAFITIAIGLFFVVLSAGYLIIYNIRRSLRKKMGKDADDEDEDDETPGTDTKPS